MSDDGDLAAAMPQIWQFVHPYYDEEDSDGDDGDNSDADADSPRGRPAAATEQDYVKLARKAPQLGRLLRYLNDTEDDEELQAQLLERDPVTQQSLLQWACLNDHFMLAEYLVRRAARGAFAFDPEWEEVVVFNRWEEMKAELPDPVEVAERQKQREQDKAARAAQRAANRANGGGGDSGDDGEGYGDDEDEDDEEDEEPEAMPEEVVHDSLDEYHEQWGERGVGVVKRVGELGVYKGARLRDGTKEGLGQSLFPGGDCYTGEYRGNQREGTGIYWWAAAATLYCGGWLHNMRHGRGRIAYPDGSRYLGGWRADRKNGEGTYVYADGSRYTGSWVDNEKHGQGRYDFTDGSSYVGSFHHGEFVSGEWWLSSGTSRYVGNFVEDRPDGAGVFVHRCGKAGPRGGTFQQEGVYRQGRWCPGTLRGNARVKPRLEVVTATPGSARVPVEFAADCDGAAYTMADLVRAANYGPLQAWLRSLPQCGLTLKRIDIVGLRYCTPAEEAEAADGGGGDGGVAAPPTSTGQRVAELRIRPCLVTADGTRLRPSGAEAGAGGDVLALREPTTRLLLLLHSGADGEENPVAVVEVVRRAGSTDEGEAQCRLPLVRMPAANGPATGSFCDRVAPALRLPIAPRSVSELVAPQQPEPLRSSASEAVLLYAQQVHPDAMTALPEKLRLLADPAAPHISYVAVPLSQLAARSTDGVTVVAAATAIERRQARTLPASTVAPQRPPTPIPPAIEPRPELQPLYAAKAARAAAAEEEADE